MTTTATNPAPPIAPASPQADLLLLRRYAATSDPDAFAQIVRQYAGCVYATCLRVLGDGARAEEASQETFFRLMRRPGDINQNLGGWLHRTATHVSLDALRSDNSRHRREIVYTQQCQHEASTWAELSPCVDQALTELPEDLRQLLVAHYLLGQTQAQLAETTGQSPATISRRIKQGLEELRSHLKLKGVYALPTALAALLCHVSSRQAPASLLRELGKMTLISAPAKSAFSNHGRSYQSQPRGWFTSIKPNLMLALGGIILAAIVLQWIAGSWSFLWPSDHSPEPQHQSQAAIAPLVP